MRAYILATPYIQAERRDDQVHSATRSTVVGTGS